LIQKKSDPFYDQNAVNLPALLWPCGPQQNIILVSVLDLDNVTAASRRTPSYPHADMTSNADCYSLYDVNLGDRQITRVQLDG